MSENNKKSFVQTLKETLGFGKKDEDVILGKLEKLGITILQDQKLQKKVLALQVLFDELEADVDTDSPTEYLEELETRQLSLNRAIHSLSFVSYRPGTIGIFRAMVRGWTLWHALAIYWIHAIEDRITNLVISRSVEKERELEHNTILQTSAIDMKTLKGKMKELLPDLLQVTTIDVWTLVRRLHTVLQMHVWQDGYFVIGCSYLGPDIAPSFATIIKTVSGRRRESLTDEDPNF